ncbi:MAG: MAPEG family protein [Synechococcaceae cyanobacterium SM2_3_1]|nr:MAPEG family protein [Synechococcaceae cyanobacterium SM2_3_1]
MDTIENNTDKEARYPLMFEIPLTAVPLLSIAAAILLVYLPVGIVVQERQKLGYDSSAPRAMFDQLPDRAKRATWAHQNGFETLTPFATTALIAYVTGPHSSPVLLGLSGDLLIALFCTLFLLFRIVYSLAYINDQPLLRSLAFGVGSLCTMGILGIALLPMLWVSASAAI